MLSKARFMDLEVDEEGKDLETELIQKLKEEEGQRQVCGLSLLFQERSTPIPRYFEMRGEVFYAKKL